jgi:dihydroorotate dehydrogenase
VADTLPHVYRSLFRHVFTRFDPEAAHHAAVAVIRLVGRLPVLSTAVHALLAGRRALPPVPVFGRQVPGLVGLAAGFDKDATAVRGLAMLGFSHVEVGTVTARAQPGNERPRLRRVLELEALVNRMGFNNDGARAAGERLRRLRATPAGRRLIVGANIGKTKVVPAEEAVADYEASAREVAPWVDYLVVNVSSPNTPGLRDLQAVEQLRPILVAVGAAADASAGHPVPLLVKIAPDLPDEDVDAVADLASELGLAGVVAVNTTIAHDYGAGGLSGPPLRPRGVAVVRRLRHRLGPGPVIIGVGGITTGDDAREYLAAGATLLQAYTAFIYRGPAWVGRLNRELAA